MFEAIRNRRTASRRTDPGQNHGQATERAADETLRWFTPDLIDTLASLDGAPPAIANAVVQLLPFGSRTALEDHGLVKYASDDRGLSGEEPRSRLVLQPLAFDVMALAAVRANDSSQAEWRRRAERAADMSEPFDGERVAHPSGRSGSSDPESRT